jgi:SAM-dependent methyltransferase
MNTMYASRYGELYRSHWWWRAREDYVLSWIERLGRTRHFGTILDVGCGDGLLLDHLSRFGEVWGVEPDRSLLAAHCPWRHRIENVAFGPAYQSNRRFDLVLLLDVLEHIERDQECLERVWSLLEPGGMAIITVPALPVLWSCHDLVNCHYRRYTQSSLRQLVDRTALRCKHLHYFFAWTVVPLYFRRLLYSGDLSRGGEQYEVNVPSSILNRLCRGMCQLEHRFSVDHGTPLGSSLFAVVERSMVGR